MRFKKKEAYLLQMYHCRDSTPEQYNVLCVSKLFLRYWLRSETLLSDIWSNGVDIHVA